VSLGAEYDRHDALGLADLVRRGEITREELLEEAIRRTEALNPRLNAVITPMYESARRSLREPAVDGPFDGVPLLLKDLLHAFAGVPLSRGSAALRGHVPDYDSVFVERLRRAGFVPFGKTNVPEFGLVAVTEPEAFGATRNPWDLSRTPGGSSGGSAAAVAAGLTPIASATDGGGSLRIPAAWCGLFGLKPSRGRVPAGPFHSEVWGGAVAEHVLTRSVRDSAAILDVLTGACPGDPFHIDSPARPFLKEIERPPPPLRIAFSVRSPLDSPVDPECRRAVHETVALLESLGHRVEEAAPRIDGASVAHAYLTMYFGQVAADVRWVAAEVGESAKRKLEAATRVLALIGDSLPSGEYVSVGRLWNRFGRIMGAFHLEYDLLLTPTTATLPLRVGELNRSPLQKLALQLANQIGAGGILRFTGLIERLALKNLEPVPFTQLANLTGQPAMSVPLHWTPEGLPCGVQFMAPVGGEALLFRLAAQLETARPWRNRIPPVHGSRLGI